MKQWMHDAMKWGSISMSILFFLIWLFQICRSALKYYKYNKQESQNIFAIHFVLFVANILYLIYECSQTDIHLIFIEFSMFFFLDIASIWTFLLIHRGTAEECRCLTPNSNRIFKGLIFLLCLIYIISFFTQTGGIKCGNHTNSKALWVLSYF